MRKLFIVWNNDKTEGYVTYDPQVAYEARKGSDNNCYDSDGNQMKLAQAFCDVTIDDNCTIEEIDVA